MSRPATQDWVHDLSIMQQSVLLSGIRGCDGLPKRHKAKTLIKWYRRCVLLSAFDGVGLTDPFAPGGGSFTGPVHELTAQFFAMPEDVQHDHKCSIMQRVSDDFVDSRDELHSHYQIHMMHAFEILGYKHPDLGIREFWNDMYVRLAHAYHLWPETELQMDSRLGDNEAGWRARNDISTSCSD